MVWLQLSEYCIHNKFELVNITHISVKAISISIQYLTTNRWILVLLVFLWYYLLEENIGRMCIACLTTIHASVASHQMSAAGGSSCEQVWTGLQSWPPDVTSRGGCNIIQGGDQGPVQRCETGCGCNCLYLPLLTWYSNQAFSILVTHYG